MHYSTQTQYKSAETRDPLHAMLSRANAKAMLTKEEEYALITRWHRTGDETAADRLISAHLRLVTKLAVGYRGYRLPLQDLISEGTLGLMKALQKFDLEKDVRFSTYGTWWVHAQMKEYVLSHWCMVKIGTNRAQKKLFFSLKRLRQALDGFTHGQTMSPAQIAVIAQDLDVSPQSVKDMEQRLSSQDYSLNLPISADDGNETEHMDLLEDSQPSQETRLIQQDHLRKRRLLLQNALSTLKPREEDILRRRKLRENPDTLKILSEEYQISRERVRQIEEEALGKITSLISTLLP